MIIEFQIDAERFLHVFRNTLMRHAPCSPQPFALNAGPCAGQQVFSDRICFESAPTLIRSGVSTIHVGQWHRLSRARSCELGTIPAARAALHHVLSLRGGSHGQPGR